MSFFIPALFLFSFIGPSLLGIKSFQKLFFLPFCSFWGFLNQLSNKRQNHYTILPEVFVRVLFSLNFAVCVGLRKLCSSFSFLNKLLRLFFLRYLQPVSNKRQGPKWACLTYCMHAKSSYITAKLASSDLPFVEQSAIRRAICRSSNNPFVKQILVNFRED